MLLYDNNTCTDNMKRRTMLGIAVAVGIDAVLEASGVGVIQQFYRWIANQITADEYEQVKKLLQNKGMQIDTAHSAYVEGASSLMIFLPDVHEGRYARKQRDRIVKVDQAIQLDTIGLEGMVGEINTEQCKQAAQRALHIVEANSLEHIRNQPADEPKQEDKPHIALQKIYRQFDAAIDVLIHTHSFHRDNEAYKKEDDPANPSSEGGKRISLFNEMFRRATGDLGNLMPKKELIGLREYLGYLDPISRHVLAMKVHERPRYSSPGFFYYDLETRAEKIGIETAEADDAAIRMVTAMELRDGIKRIISTLRSVDEAYKAFCAASDQNNLLTFQGAYQRFKSSLESYIGIMEADRRTFQGDQPEVDANSPLFQEVIIDKRSRQWVKNASQKRITAIIGGAGHTQSVYEAAKNSGNSIITLNALD